MLVCICRLHYEFERVFPSSFLWTFNQLWSCFDLHFLIFFRDLNRNFYLKQLIDFGAFSFLISISFHIFQTYIFHFLFPHFFSSKSPLGHNISCLMIYLGSVILISFILYQELYLLFDLIKVIKFPVSPLSHFDFDHEGAVIINFNPWFSFINFILDFFKSKFICILCPDVFPSRPHIWVVLWSQINLTLQFLSLTTCVPELITH